MSAVVVISPEDLEKLIERAVRKALDEAGATRPSDEFVPRKTVKLPRATLAKLVKDGDVRTSKVGREKYVHSGDVEKWLASQVERPRPDASNVVEMPEPSDPFEAARVRARAERRRSA